MLCIWPLSLSFIIIFLFPFLSCLFLFSCLYYFIFQHSFFIFLPSLPAVYTSPRTHLSLFPFLSSPSLLHHFRRTTFPNQLWNSRFSDTFGATDHRLSGLRTHHLPQLCGGSWPRPLPKLRPAPLISRPRHPRRWTAMMLGRRRRRRKERSSLNLTLDWRLKSGVQAGWLAGWVRLIEVFSDCLSLFSFLSFLSEF